MFSSSATCKSPTFTEGKGVNEKSNNKKKGRRHIPSASTALIVGGILGLVQAIFLIFCAKPLLNIMGVKSVSTCGFQSIHLHAWEIDINKVSDQNLILLFILLSAALY